MRRTRNRRRIGTTLAIAGAVVASVIVSFAGPTAARPQAPAAVGVAEAGGPYTFTLSAPATAEIWRPLTLSWSLTNPDGTPVPRTQVQAIVDGRISAEVYTWSRVGPAPGTTRIALRESGRHLVALLALQWNETHTQSSWIALSNTMTVTATPPPTPGVQTWGFAKRGYGPVVGAPSPAGFAGSIAADGSVSGSISTTYDVVALDPPTGITGVLRLTDFTITGRLDSRGRLTATGTARVDLAAMNMDYTQHFMVSTDTLRCRSVPVTFPIGGTYHDGDLDLLALDVVMPNPASAGECDFANNFVQLVFGMPNARAATTPLSFLLRIENPPSAFTPTG